MQWARCCFQFFRPKRRFCSVLLQLGAHLTRSMASGGCLSVLKAGGYAVYVLFLLLGAYLLNQLDRYALGATSQPMAQDIHFGDKGCLPYNSTFSSNKEICVKSFLDSDKVEKNKTLWVFRDAVTYFDIFILAEKHCESFGTPCFKSSTAFSTDVRELKSWAE